MSTRHPYQEGPASLSAPLSPAPSDEMSPIHLTLNVLPAEFQLAVDIEQGLVSLVYGPAGKSASHARILRHQEFSHNSIRVLSVLLKEATYCPFEYLLAALQAPHSVIHSLLLSTSDRPVYEQLATDKARFQQMIVDLASFEQLTEKFAERISEAVPGAEREWLLRPMRRTMSEVTPRIKAFGLSVFTLRTLGYRLQQVNQSQHAHSLPRQKALGDDKGSGHTDRVLIPKAS